MRCFLNGEFLPLAQARVSPLDRGFMFGDGVYEVTPVYGGRLFYWRRHVARLARSLRAIRLAFDAEGLTGPARQLAADFVAEHGAAAVGCLYAQITRGEMAVRGLPMASGAAAPPTVFMMCSAYSAAAGVDGDGLPAAVACVSAQDIRWRRCDIKSVSLLGAALLAPEAGSGAEETMIFRDGVLSEGSRGNFIVVRDGELLVPVADHRLLDGVTCGVVCELARGLGRRVVARDIMAEEVWAADEVWLTSSMRELLPVGRVDDRVIGNGRAGAVFAEVHAAWRAHVAGGEWTDG